MKTKKHKKAKTKPKPKKYAKRLSLWPLKPEDALESFMCIPYEDIKAVKKDK